MSNTQQPSPLAVIYAGEDVFASLLDDTRVLVRVRSLPVRQLGRLLRVADDEAALLELVCFLPSEGEKPFIPVTPEFVDNLVPESHDKLYEAAKRLNFSRAAKWAERHLADRTFVQEIGLKADEILQPLMQRLVASLTSLQQPPAKPAEASKKS
jgi:hypothetical protein